MAEPHGDRAFRFFGPEFAEIKDQRIKDFTRRCFDVVCPDYFWVRAASKSGKYHPSFVTGDGGLARHVKYVCYWVGQNSRAWSGNGQGDDIGPQNLFDCAMSAAIMHDMVKEGDPGRRLKPTTIPMINYHGVELMEAIYDRVLGGKIEFDEQLLILYGVAAHMGIWTKPEKFQPWNLTGGAARQVATLVHMSDYAASRKIEDIISKIAVMKP